MLSSCSPRWLCRYKCSHADAWTSSNALGAGIFEAHQDALGRQVVAGDPHRLVPHLGHVDASAVGLDWPQKHDPATASGCIIKPCCTCEINYAGSLQLRGHQICLAVAWPSASLSQHFCCVDAHTCPARRSGGTSRSLPRVVAAPCGGAIPTAWSQPQQRQSAPHQRAQPSSLTSHCI